MLWADAFVYIQTNMELTVNTDVAGHETNRRWSLQFDYLPNSLKKTIAYTV